LQKIMVVVLLGMVLALTGCSLNKPAPKPEPPKVQEGVTLNGTAIGNLSLTELEALLAKTAAESYIAPINAGFDENGGISQSRKGRRLNTGAVIAQVMSAPPYSHISSVYQDILPYITTESLNAANKAGSYTTPILDGQPNRMHNIKLTAKLINNSVIDSGSEFSFNKVSGEPTAERGFKEATVFADDGRHEQGIGGGMCQVSSTLYNAALAMGLIITERHPHSQPVDYVPPNRDATTYTDKDLRFINNTRQTLIIRAFVSGKELTVDLFALLPQ
jgi:vancomycin resistance protein YoaR